MKATAEADPALEGHASARFVSAVGSFALAIGAVLGFAELTSGGPHDGRASQPDVVVSAEEPVTSQSAAYRRPRQLLVYFVATESGKRALEQDLARSSWFEDPTATLDTSVRIVVFDDEAEESLATLDRLLPEA